MEATGEASVVVGRAGAEEEGAAAAPLPKKLMRFFCAPENSLYLRVANAGASAFGPSRRRPGLSSSHSLTLPRPSISISSWKSTKTGQWSEPVTSRWMSEFLIQGSRPGVTRM